MNKQIREIVNLSSAVLVIAGFTACDLELSDSTDAQGNAAAEGPTDSVNNNDEGVANEGNSVPPSSSTSLEADFNGDGYADLAIGVPGESLGSSLPSAGAVNVIYGSSDGLDAAGNQLWTQDTSGVEGVAEADDRFGSTLAAGDFNDDGYADLAIGVPHEGIGDKYRAGAVNVLYGSPSGLIASGSQLWHQDISGIADQSEFNDKFGSALAVGDFDDDGYDDLAIGVPDEDLMGHVDAGVVHVIYGSSDGLAAAGDELWHQGVPGVTGTLESEDRFGSALAAGDFDDDGNADLAIGVPFEDVGSIVDAGLVHVLYGTNGGLGVDNDQTWHQDSSGIQGKAEAFDQFGAALAVGDFDDDDNDDLAIGVPRDDVGSVHDAGAVNVIFGGVSGLDALDDQLLTQDTTGVEGVSDSFDMFGQSLASGDFDDDGHADLAIGVPGEDLGDESSVILDAGAVNVVYGSSGGISSKNSQLFTQDTSGISGSADNFDAFGWALTAGDFDGDDRADLAIGVPFEDVSGEADAGAVNVIYGSKSGLAAKGDQLWHQDSSGVEGVADEHDQLGSALR